MADQPQKTAATRKAELEKTIDLAQNATHYAIERSVAQLATGQVRDPAGAARNLATVLGISIDKLHALQDRPTEIPHEPRDATEILRGIENRIPHLFIRDSTGLPEPAAAALPAASDRGNARARARTDRSG